MSTGSSALGGASMGNELLERADAALYRAKRRGRNRVCSEGDSEAQPRCTQHSAP